MEKLTEQDCMSLDVVEENLIALKKIFPEAFTEDGIDFEVLRQLLGDEVVEGDEKYGLNWFGKKKARQIALAPSVGTLRPCPEESVDWDMTQNLFIEGDNLEVLKLLQKSYSGKVKMIYIDPPYNTGKEFVYPDNYQDNLDTYLRYTGQISDDGFKISTNKETSGRKHTNWLNMMYSRLRLARSLLSDEGVIVVSIDENEQSNLVKICQEIFGEENYCGEIVWKNSSKNDQDYISIQHEYFVVFVKSKAINKGVWVEKKEGLDQIYKAFDGFRKDLGDDWNAIHKKALEFYNSFPESNPIRASKHYNWMDDRGVYFASDASGPNVGQYVYEIYHPITKKPVKQPARGWFCPEDNFLELVADDRVHFGDDENKVPCLKTYLKDTETTSLSSLRFKDGRAASKRLKALFGEAVFTNPKDEELLRDLLKAFGVGGNDIVLDFFAGSASTYHAVQLLNIEQESSCSTILVQLPEDLNAMYNAATGLSKKIIKNSIDYLSDRKRPNNLCEIAKQRMRLTGSAIKTAGPSMTCDLGFKVFKLDSSNIVAWHPEKADLEQTLIAHTEHLIPNRSEQDVLYELLLKRGVELTVPIEEKEVSGKTVYSIGFGALFACLDKNIERNQIENLAQGIIDWHNELDPVSETQVVFRDSAFENDIAKTNITAILEQSGIKHVRSL